MSKKYVTNGSLDITKYTQDPHVYYNGRKDDEKLAKVVGLIKAVKLG